MNVVICDDDSRMCELLARKIKTVFPDSRESICYSGKELLDSGEKPDILLLDIRMPGMDGLEVAKHMRASGFRGILIFITGEGEHVFDAFDVQAFHYLVKPFSEEKLKAVLLAAERQLKDWQKDSVGREKERVITVYASGTHRNINLSEVLYAEVYDRKLVVHTLKREIEYDGQLSGFAKLAGEDFYRTHRSYLVHMKYIESYDRTKAVLRSGEEVPLAKRNYPDFVKRYMEYAKRQRSNG